MSNEVKLPELGESVTSGIIIEWLVAVGDTVEVDQPLFELSTDKIDTEVPSPFAGVVQELRAEVDDEVEVGSVVMVIGDGDGAPAADSDDDAEPDAEPEAEASAEADEKPEKPEKKAEEKPAAKAAPEPKAAPQPAPAAKAAAPAPSGNSGGPVLTSPLVRKLLREASIDPAQVQGTGDGGRITREDADRAIAQGPSQTAAPASAPAGLPAARPAAKQPDASPTQIDFGGQREKTEPLSRVRKSIAKHMLESITTTAQLTAVVEVDMTRVMTTRAAAKDAFKAREGASLSPLPIISRAVVMTLPRHPALNSSIDTEAGEATYRSYVNLGMAVDTDNGLIVPNIKDAQDLTVAGLAKRIADVADRTRNKKLQPDDISGGTFTITNTGSRGAMIDTPILNPPEVAILATTLIEKRPVVITDEFGGDSIGIRWMSYLCLSYDHRMVDGADAARFLGDLKYTLENHDFGPEVGLQV